jgi:glutamine synthetase
MSQVSAEELDRLRGLCEAHAVRTVECMLVDTWGIPRGKRVPVEQFLRGTGFHIANVIYTWDPRCGINPTPWVGEKDGFPDMHAVPDPSSFRIAGWAEGVAVVMCDAVDAATGEPVVLDSRGMLKRALADFEARDLHVQTAAELEFYLTTPDGRPVYDDIHCYSFTKGAEYEPVLGEIRESLRRTGIEVEACNLEYGPAQVEINLRYGPTLDTADATVIFKYVVRQIARRHGCDVTFMAKPFQGQSGSGMHVHQSVSDGAGANLFAAQDLPGPVRSGLMRRYLSGLLAHHKELQAVMIPTINGYKRIEDYSFSPTQVTWGLDHRLVGVRCIADQGPANRLEARWAAADANPYLVLNGCLQAGLDGIREDLPLLDMVTGDPHVDDRWDRLPTSLAEAVTNFEASPFAKRAYGERFVEVFAVMQRHEIATYTAHVSDWETARYRDVI